MQKRTKWLIAGGTLAAVALLAWAFAPRPVEVEVARASIGAFETTIDEDGKTRLTERYVVSAPLAGRLARISLREGDAVAANAVVATLTPVLSPMLDERSLRELSARLEAARANVERAATRIDRAKVAHQQAQLELKRSEQLAQQGFVAPTKLDNDRLAVTAAQKEVEAAVGDSHVASHELEVARAALLLREGLVRDVADEVLEEPVLAVLGRCWICLDAEDLLARERAQERVEVGLGDTSYSREPVSRKGLAENGRVLE